MRSITHPFGSCLYSVFFRVPAVQTRPSSLHRLHGNSPSHCTCQSKPRSCEQAEQGTTLVSGHTLVFFMRHRSHAFHTRLWRPSPS